MEHLREIYEKFDIKPVKVKLSDQNNKILRIVKSKNKKRIVKLNSSINTLLQNIDKYKISGQNEITTGKIKSDTLKLIPQIKKIAGLD